MLKKFDAAVFDDIIKLLTVTACAALKVSIWFDNVVILLRKVLLIVSVTKLLKLIFSSFITVLNVEKTESSKNIAKDVEIGPKNDNCVLNIVLLNNLTPVSDEVNVDSVILKIVLWNVEIFE